MVGRPLIPGAARGLLPFVGRLWWPLTLAWVLYEIYEGLQPGSDPGGGAPQLNSGWIEDPAVPRCNPDNWDYWGRHSTTGASGWAALSACPVSYAFSYAHFQLYGALGIPGATRYSFATLSSDHAVVDTGVSYQGRRAMRYIQDVPTGQPAPSSPPYTISPAVRFYPIAPRLPMDPLSDPIGVPLLDPIPFPVRAKWTWPWRAPKESPEVGPWGPPRPRPWPSPFLPPGGPHGPRPPRLPFRFWPFRDPTDDPFEQPMPGWDEPVPWQWPVQQWVPWPFGGGPPLPKRYLPWKMGIDAVWRALQDWLRALEDSQRPRRFAPGRAVPRPATGEPLPTEPGVWIPDVPVTRPITVIDVTQPQPQRPPPPGQPPIAPPVGGEKEAKVKAPPGLIRVFRGLVYEATELNDFIEALHNALPDHLRSSRNGPRGRALAVWRHFDQIDVAQALGNILLNEIEDRAIGRSLGGARSVLRNYDRRGVRRLIRRSLRRRR